MKRLIRTAVLFVLATSLSTFAASKKPDVPKAPNVDNAATEAKAAPCPAAQEINPEKSCVICQIQSSEDIKEKAARQKLIQEQEKEWLKNLDYAR